MGGMKFSLRTLLILTAMLPPILAGFSVAVIWAASLTPDDFENLREPFIVVAGVAGVASYLAVEYAVVLSERAGGR